MRWSQKGLLFTVLAIASTLFLLRPASGQAQGITLKHVPYELIPPSGTVEITWEENIQATLYYGPAPGVHSSHLDINGRKSLRFSPQDVGLQPGVYFCVISNGLLQSSEFQLIIENQNAPAMRAPANNSRVETVLPEFRWDPVPGVPYYHIVVSDQEAHIIEDPATGDLRLVGANIVWQAITPNTSIRYGDPDPSQQFSRFNQLSPPLVSGKTYNWAVLNNYGNHPALSSIVQAGLFGFTTQFSTSLQKPTLGSPAADAHLTDRNVTFTWQTVPNAHHYALYLFEFLEEETSESSYPVYRAVTTGTSVELDARSLLKAGQYVWEVLAFDDAGYATASENRTFWYDVAVSAVTLNTRMTNGATLPRVKLDLVAQNGSQEVTSLLTTDSGVLTVPVQAGNYTVYASKEGFADTLTTFRIDPEDSISVTVFLRRLPATLNGRVVNASGQALDGASVEAVSSDGERHFQTTSVDGRFSLHLPRETWQVWATRSGYAPSESVVVNLSGDQQSLPEPLVLPSLEVAVTGHVNTDQGQSVAGATVTAQSDEFRVQARTDASAAFTLHLSPGTWVLRAEMSGYAPSDPRVLDVSGTSVAVDPPLQVHTQAVSVVGSVRSGSTALPGARIVATPPSGSPVETVCDPRGNFSLSLVPGSYDLSASKSGYVAAPPVHLELVSGQQVEAIEFDLSPASATVSGHVRSASGQPLQNAVVRAGETADTTALDGGYTLRLSPGQHVLSASRSGFSASAPVRVELKPGEVKTGVNFQLSPQAAEISGTIRTDGTTVAGARIVARSGTDSVATFSDALGKYTLSLAPKIWTLRVTKTGFAAAERGNLALQAGQKLENVDFSLTENAGYVTGLVRDPASRPIAGAHVTTADSGLTAFSASNGRYTLRLSPGSYVLMATADGYGTQAATTTINAGGTATLNFTLPTEGTLQGHVKGSDGPPVWAAIVQAIRGTDTLTTYTDHNGDFLCYLPGGSYKLVIDQLGYLQYTTSVTVNPGAQVTRNVTLTADPSEIASLRGHVRTVTGQAMPGVHLSLRGHEKRNLSTNPDGTYEIQRLEAGYNFTLTPTRSGWFFLPSSRSYGPLQGNPTGQNFEASLYGDVSANDRVSSFDGSLVLRISAQQDISPYYKHQPRDSIAADVSGNGAVSSFDASLIFRYSVGLIPRFPVDNAPDWLPKPAGTGSYSVRLDLAQVFRDTLVYVLTAAGEQPFFSCDARVAFDGTGVALASVQSAPRDSSVRLAYRTGPDGLRLALASLKPLRPGIPFAQLRFLKKRLGVNRDVHLLSAQIDESEAVVLNAGQDGQGTFRFLGTSPNPFNAEVVFRFFVPTSKDKRTFVEIQIYDVLGRQVRILRRSALRAGYLNMRWDGTSRDGKSVASGIYFARIRFGSNLKVAKIVCVR